MLTMMPYRRNTLTNGNVFDLWDAFTSPFFGMEGPTDRFRVDVKDEGDRYEMEADMPGMRKEDLNIEIQDGTLTISAQNDTKKKEKKDNYVYQERRMGSYRRSFTLEGIDEEKIQAAYENGVLKLTLPKIPEKEEPTRKIAIA